jgi:hypothetical protein
MNGNVTGKLVVGVILLLGLVAGASIYYLQVYHFYREIPATGAQDVTLITLADGTSQPIEHSGFTAIDADSSPIRYRACFTTSLTPDQASALYVPAPGIDPRNAPGWFDCFDAKGIAAAISDGTMVTFLSTKNYAFGVDRIVAIGADGRGFIWPTLNECGTKAYDGSLVGEECPARPASQ